MAALVLKNLKYASKHARPRAEHTLSKSGALLAQMACFLHNYMELS